MDDYERDGYIGAAIPWGIGTVVAVIMALTGCCAPLHVLFIGWLIFTGISALITWAGMS